METRNQETPGHETVDQVAEKVHKAVDKAAASLAVAEERTRKGAAEAVETVREGKEYAQTRTEDLLATVTRYVRENPLTALGIAFVAGSIFSSRGRR